MDTTFSFNDEDTIVAVATAPGTGGIAVIRLSGPNAFPIASRIWKGADLAESCPNLARYGSVYDPATGNAIDDGLATPFHGPASFTGEDTVEFAVHGSKWIQREVVRLLIDAGARMADHGEFTRRAFQNGKLDLAQAEGIADLIASSSRAAHRLALTQTRGGFSRNLDRLRDRLIEFASLLELELDFSEEDVEFADRKRLRELADETIDTIERLAASYASGRAIKDGVPVVIAGQPNAGKSTLLNMLLGDDKAIVSDIPGTTRDIIEDTVEIDGILFRIIDTAGLRETEDHVERLGIDRTRAKLAKAAIVIRLLDATAPLLPQLKALAAESASIDARTLTVLNKTDLQPTDSRDDLQSTRSEGNLLRSQEILSDPNLISISAKTGEGIDELKKRLTEIAEPAAESDMIVTNARHYESLVRSLESLRRARTALDTSLSADFIAQDIREALHHLSTITGAITAPDLLQSIFARFCIGK